MKKVIATSTAPAALGPYSQAVLVDQTLYASGQIGLKPETGSLNGADVTSQTKQIMANMGAVLTAAGMNYADVVKTTIFLTNVADFTVVNDLYATYSTLLTLNFYQHAQPSKSQPYLMTHSLKLNTLLLNRSV